MKTINELIKEIKNDKKIGFMGHIIAGYPDINISYEAGLGICEGGADFLEVQFPFSDPPADGPTIEEACYKSLESGFTIEKGFELIKKLTSQTQTIIFIMTYANIIYKYGIEKFIVKSKDVGAQGVIIPDIPFENDEGLNDICKKYNVANIFVAAPGADAERIKTLSKTGSGILYTVVRRGITGKKTELDKNVFEWLKLVKDNSKLPVAAGFGIQTKEQIEELVGHCEIAVVGSFFVRTINNAIEKNWDVKEKLFNVTKSLIDD